MTSGGTMPAAKQRQIRLGGPVDGGGGAAMPRPGRMSPLPKTTGSTAARNATGSAETTGEANTGAAAKTQV